MAVDLTAIRSALAGQIRDGVDREVNVYDGYVPSSPSAPCLIVKPASEYMELELTYNRPLCTMRFEVWVLTAPGLETDGQRLLDQFCSVGTGQTNSIYDAIGVDRTLGGLLVDGGVFVTGVEYRDRGLFGTPDSQALFDWAVVLVTVAQRG